MAGLGAPVLEAYSGGYDSEKYRQTDPWWTANTIEDWEDEEDAEDADEA